MPLSVNKDVFGLKIAVDDPSTMHTIKRNGHRESMTQDLGGCLKSIGRPSAIVAEENTTWVLIPQRNVFRSSALRDWQNAPSPINGMADLILVAQARFRAFTPRQRRYCQQTFQVPGGRPVEDLPRVALQFFKLNTCAETFIECNQKLPSGIFGVSVHLHCVHHAASHLWCSPSAARQAGTNRSLDMIAVATTSSY
jgi:hypothetical protein